MECLLKAEGLKKTFRLSKKQMKLDKTDKSYKIAVDGLSFRVFNGEIYGLLGPNGAGKTTVMRILSTLIKSDEGDALICGASVKSNPSAVRKSLAFLTSELKLDEFFTPNYLYDFYSALRGVSNADRDSRKAMLFNKFGISKFSEVKVGELSTGMKQKVSLAVSLAHDPRVIVYDEPTNGLDVLTAKTVTDFLQELKEQGKCIIVSTHIFSLVEKVCDRIGVIINGKMASEGTLREVCTGKTLEDAFFDIYAKNVAEN
ncbi:MAG: ABC transporter ATP-binding protein [Dehalococcoidia bacterium]|nr:ABC transporter ATP-binding protein [Dehalococcoidia bacterium]